ncbi:MAG: zinc metallopeptidase [Myxococcota bacterium]
MLTALAHALVEALSQRWLILLLAALPFLLTSAVSTLFVVVHQAVSGRRPDELPISTGEWVQDALHAQGLTDVQVGPTPAFSAGMDAFWPNTKYIALKPKTLHRKDPVYWAIGAHELGHALHAKGAVSASVFPAARAMSLMSTQLLTAALVAAFFTGSYWVLSVGLAIAALALFADVVILIDEGWASATALKLLREDGRLTPTQLGRATASLIAALGAYVAGFSGRCILLLLWLPATAPLDGPIWDTPEPLGWPWLIVLAALTLPMIKRAVRVVLRSVTPTLVERLSDLGPRMMKENAGDLAGGLGALAFVLVALTQPASIWRDLCLVLALAPALVPITALLGSFVLLPVRLLMHEVDRVGRKSDLLEAGVIPDDHAPPTRAMGPPVLTLAMHNDPSVARRSLEWMRVAYLPLIVAVWVAIMTAWS